MVSRRREPESAKPKRPPATTPEARENQMIALAMDTVEERLRNGTATSQEVTHFLKLGTSREKLEQERLKRENELLAAKAEQLASQKKIEELYAEALGAMRSYQGQEPLEIENYDED